MSFHKLRKTSRIAVILLLIFNCTFSAFAVYPPTSIKVLGGSYEGIRNQQYDTSQYEAHHLIAKEAWNTLGDEIEERQGITRYNDFVVDDLNQNWAPSILMEKSDHEKTASYYNSHTRTAQQNEAAEKYIDYQTEILLSTGDVSRLLNKECNIIKRLFPGKYDYAIAQMFKYMQGKFWIRDGILFIKNPSNPSWSLMYKIG